MAFEITIPRLGWSMEEGTFVRWLKNDGDLIQIGDAIYELEGEKAAQDIESVDQGILRIPLDAPRPGSVVAVGSVIGYLAAADETVPALPAQATAPIHHEPSPEPEAEEIPAAAPSVRRKAREMGVNLSAVTGTGPAGKILMADLPVTTRPLAPNSDSAVASPRAKRVAKELGIDWHRLAGSGRDGRVRERDVRQAAEQDVPTSGAQPVPISSRRRTIAQRMQASHNQTVPVTLTTKIDATNLVNLRSQFKAAANGALTPSYQDMVIKLVSLALQQHPLLAARSQGDTWVIPQSAADYHVGFAVDTDDGLVVPVVRQAGTLSLFEIAKRSLALIEKARLGKLTVAEMQDGVFTITNLGNFGVDAFTPIINLPESGVLGLGRIRREAVVVEDQIVARDQITLSLTFDHRIIDGAPAARFLKTVSEAIENPSAWLLRGEG